MSKFNVEIASKEKIDFGEGPHWDPITGRLHYVNCFAKSVVSLKWPTATSRGIAEEQSSAKLNLDDAEYISFAIPVRGEEESQFLCSAGNLIGIGHKNSESFEPLHTQAGGHFNDAKCDSKGRLWVGFWKEKEEKVDSLLDTAERFQGSLCSVDKGTFAEHSKGFTFTNGICFSADEKKIYTVDSRESHIVAQDFDVETGTVGENKKVVFEYKPKDHGHDPKSILDGMVSDVRGNLWIALYIAGKVIDVDVETGKIVSEITFPTPLTTSLCFGGTSLNELFVTSCGVTLPNLSDHLSTAPHGGHVFRVTLEEDNLFKGNPMHSYVK